MTTESQPSSGAVSRLAKAAGIISLGNIISRLLGLAREFVKANLFGATGLVSAFEVANLVPTIAFDLLVGGMISSALVPVLSDYASQRTRRDFWRLVSTLISLAAVGLSAFVLLAELFAPQIAWLFGARGFDDPSLWPTATHLLRLMLPAILFLNLAGLLTGVLHSLKRFALPAFTAAVFNAAIVVVAIARPERIDSLAWGVLIGAVLQVLLQLPGFPLHQLRWHWDLSHPALRRIVKLYLPIVLGVVVSYLAVVISYNLATQTGDESVAIMRYATTLIQFPLGLVATAISLAILPTLAEHAARPGGDDAFKATLAQGLKLVIILIIPAAVGLFLLAAPIVGLAFERGDFGPQATQETAIVLRYYLLGLPFAAVDQQLIFAFYARKNTLSPALVGVLSVVIYLLAAVLLLKPMGLYSLMIADSLKHLVHAAVMTWLLHRQTGGLRGNILATTGKALLASAIMACAVTLLMHVAPAADHLASRLLVVVGGGGLGVTLYLLAVLQLRVPEARLLFNLITSRLGSKQK